MIDLLQYHGLRLARRALADDGAAEGPEKSAGVLIVELLLLVFFTVATTMLSHISLVVLTLAETEATASSPITLTDRSDDGNDEDSDNEMAEANIGFTNNNTTNNATFAPQIYLKTNQPLLKNGGYVPVGSNARASSLQSPLTASIRGTLAHVRSIGGIRNGLFRGFWHFVFVLAVALAVRILGLVCVPRSAGGIANSFAILAGDLLTILATVLPRAALAHRILSTTPRAFFARFPPLKTWKHLIKPTMLNSVAVFTTIFIPAVLAILLGRVMLAGLRSGGVVDGGDGDGDGDGSLAANKGHLVGTIVLGVLIVVVSLAVMLALTYTLLIPAAAALTRVQASLLPPSDETIMPFDHTFGGRTVPAGIVSRNSTGGDGNAEALDVLGTRSAFRSVTTADRRRLFKLHIKLAALLLAPLLVVGGIASQL